MRDDVRTSAAMSGVMRVILARVGQGRGRDIRDAHSDATSRG